MLKSTSVRNVIFDLLAEIGTNNNYNNNSILIIKKYNTMYEILPGMIQDQGPQRTGEKSRQRKEA
jgi:hypothetical protein